MFEFRLLGPMEVRDGGVVVEIPPRKLRELLALLLLGDGAAISTDRIETSIWHDRQLKNAKASIQVYVSQLRTRLGDSAHSLIERTDNGYRLDTDGHSVDVRTFDDLVGKGLDLLNAQEPEGALQAFDESLGMIRGEPLSDFASCEFARPYVDYVSQRRSLALEGRLEARLALGSHRHVIAEARSLVHEDPYNEEVWALLMVALYRSHRRTEALRSYQIAVAELGNAGLEPTERLRKIETQILTEDPSLLPSSIQPPNNLPDGAGPGVDADVEVDVEVESSTLVRDLQTEVVVTLTGPQAMIRATAVEAARTSIADFTDGAWLVELDERDGKQLASRAALDALGIIPGPDPEKTLADYLSARTVLLVFLGADYVAEEINRIAELLNANSSRSRLVLTAAEPPTSVTGLVRMITQSTVSKAGARSELQADLLASRTRVFGGPVPLEAIRNVAAFQPIDPADADYLLGQLLADYRLRADNTGPVTRFYRADDRGRKLNDPDLLRAIHLHTTYYFNLATRVAGGFDGPGRRDLLQTAKAEHEEFRVAIENALAADRVEEALHIGHAAGRFWSSEGTYVGQTLSVLGPLAERITGPSADSAGVHMSLGFANFRSGAYGEAANNYDRAVEYALGEGQSALAGWGLAERGHLRMFLGEHAAATVDLREARRLADIAGSPSLQARTLMLAAQLGMRSSDPFGRDAQRDQLDEAILIYDRLGHSSGQASSLLVKSSWHIDAGETAAAVDAAQRALDIAQLGDDRSILGFALVRSAEALFVDGDLDAANARAVEAVAAASEIGNWLVVSLGLLAVGISGGANVPGDRRTVDAHLLVAAFVAIRRELGVPLTEREIEWAGAFTDLDGGDLSNEEARDIAYRLSE